jgi:hypothetical protein
VRHDEKFLLWRVVFSQDAESSKAEKNARILNGNRSSKDFRRLELHVHLIISSSRSQQTCISD